MSINDLSPYWGNEHQSEPTESYDAYSHVPTVTQDQWSLNSLEALAPGLVTPSVSKNAATPSSQCSSTTASTEGRGDRTNVVATDMSQDPTTMSQRGNALADDERFIRRSEEELRKDQDRRMECVWGVIGWIAREGDCRDSLKEHQLWLSIIEGNVDDDVWLWVDGDEEWLAKHEIPYYWSRPVPTDWLDAQSALRRRVTLQRYPPATARNEKVRSATPEERVCAIAWLIASSKGVAELFASHGRTPPTFRAPEIARSLIYVIGQYWGAFPSHNGAWESVLRKSKEDGCICSLADCRGMRQWFDMMVWLEGDIPRNLEIGYEPCVRCRSLLKSRYEGLAANCTVTSHVSLLDVICNCSRTPRSSSSPGPTANLLVNRILEPLMRQHDFDVRYLPSVNRYPTPLRQYVAKPLRPQRYSRRVKFTHKMFDGVHDPWVVLGIVALATCRAPAGKGTDSHNGKRHSYFSSFLRHSLECFDMPVLPQLSSTGLMLCHTLDQDCFEEYSFGHAHRAIDDDSGWVKSDQDGRQLRLSTAVMVAVTTFLHNKDVGLYGCRRCRNICMESFAGTSSTVWFGVANSRGRAGLGPSSAHIRGEDDVLGGDHPSLFQGSLDIAMQEPAGMEAFTTYLRDPTLSKDEVQLQMVAGFLKLRQYIESYGLDASDCFHRSDGDSRPRLEHVPGHGTSSSKLSKSDKVEVIKGKLLEMLRELNLPSERLPWYTLEKDLEKHGCALINWPAEVLRKRGNRGIHDLSAVEVNTLYEAITCPDELRRLHICRRPSTLTVVSAQQVDHTSVAASGSKRPLEDLPGHSSKRIRFKDMTSKVSQQRLSDPRADGTAES